MESLLYLPAWFAVGLAMVIPLVLAAHQTRALGSSLWLLSSAGCLCAALALDELPQILLLHSAAFWFGYVGSADASTPARENVRWVVMLVLADLLAVAGLALLSNTFPSLPLSQIQAEGWWAAWQSHQPATVNSIATLLLTMFVVRLGLYPCMGWQRGVAWSSPAAMWWVGGLMPVSLLLLFQLRDLLLATPEARLLMVGVGTLSLILLSLIAWFQTDASAEDAEPASLPTGIAFRRRLLALVSAWCGMLWVGMIAGVAPNPYLLGMTVAGLCLGSVCVLRSVELQSPPGWMVIVAALSHALLLPGALAATQAANQAVKLPAIAGRLEPLMILGQLLSWLALLFLLRSIRPRNVRTQRLYIGTLLVGLLGAGMAIGLMPQLQLSDTNWWAAALPVVALAFVLLDGRRQTEAVEEHSLNRLANYEFYVNSFVDQSIAYPLWCLQLVVSYLTQLLFVDLPFVLARTLWITAQRTVEEMDEPAARTLHWEIVLFTCGVLIAAAWVSL